MGIFTTRDIRKNDNILAAPDGPSITLLTDEFRAQTQKFPANNWLELWGNYAWGRGHGVPAHVSYESNSIFEFQITIGALPNHNCVLDAIAARFPEPAYDDSQTDHRASPGTGAYSYNRGRDFFVERDVQAGEELFLNYGHCQRDSGPKWADGLTMPADYRHAVAFMKAVAKAATVKDYSKNEKITIPEDMDPIVAKLIPKNFKELKSIMGNRLTTEALVKELVIRTSINERTPQWIRENGRCLEHLVLGPSTLPYAGNGGIAQHFIEKGHLIVPAPLVHIMDRDQLAVHDDDGHKTGDQLMLNYCLGHRDSTLLLCPNTNAILINHCSKRSKDCQPNAILRWSEGWDVTSDEWRTMGLGELSRQPYRGLSMEVVALRDISPGEEVFMDYGIAWEEAWKQHIASWQAPEPILISAKEANVGSNPPAFLISGDLRAHVNHPHMFSGCQYWPTAWDEDNVWNTADPEWRNLTDAQLLHKYADDGSSYVGDYSSHRGSEYWPCVIIRPEKNSDTFTVRILQSPFEREKQNWAKKRVPRFLTNYPRESIHFFVRKGAGDQYLPDVFRHHIEIPDEIFPAHWKNLAE